MRDKLEKFLDGSEFSPSDFLASVPDILRMLRGAVMDSRTPWHAKAAVPAALVYLVSPFDLVPDWIPGAGQLDDAFLIVHALRYLLRSAGNDVLADHWDGDEETFHVLLSLAKVTR